MSPEDDQAVAGVLASLDPPVLVVTTADGDGVLAGCLVGFLTQCSIRPVRFIVCLSKLNRTFFVAERSSNLAVHVLSEEQSDIARLFGEETGDVTDKFARCEWTPGQGGVPILARCAAWVSGVVLGRFHAGDHEALLLSQSAGGRGTAARPLTYRALPDLTAGHPAE